MSKVVTHPTFKAGDLCRVGRSKKVWTIKQLEVWTHDDEILAILAADVGTTKGFASIDRLTLVTS